MFLLAVMALARFKLSLCARASLTNCRWSFCFNHKIVLYTNSHIWNMPLIRGFWRADTWDWRADTCDCVWRNKGAIVLLFDVIMPNVPIVLCHIASTADKASGPNHGCFNEYILYYYCYISIVFYCLTSYQHTLYNTSDSCSAKRLCWIFIAEDFWSLK